MGSKSRLAAEKREGGLSKGEEKSKAKGPKKVWGEGNGPLYGPEKDGTGIETENGLIHP